MIQINLDSVPQKKENWFQNCVGFLDWVIESLVKTLSAMTIEASGEAGSKYKEIQWSISLCMV